VLHFILLIFIIISIFFLSTSFTKKRPKQSGALLGNYDNNPLYLSDYLANHHTLVVGTTGSGKTTTICNVVEYAIIQKYPMIYIDGKGDKDLFARVENFAKKNNRPFYYFSMSGKSMAYNPLVTGGYSAKKDRIIAIRHWSEEHYRKLAEAYLQTVLQILQKYEIPLDLKVLSKYLDLTELFLMARQFKDQDSLNKLSYIKENYQEISGLKAEFDILVNSEIGHLFDCSNEYIDLNKAREENAVVYFCLSPLQFPHYANMLGKLIINDLKSIASTKISQKDNSYTFCILDEFSIFADEQVVNLINQGRSAGFCTFLATQSLADLSKFKGEVLLEQIISNCNNYIFQRQNNPKDANLIANIIGEYTKYNVEHLINEQNISHKINLTKDFRVSPDEVKYLPQGYGYYLGKNEGKLCLFKSRFSEINK
jgi:type IV secretory pathway TraG/TraD family ATPase VirD4